MKAIPVSKPYFDESDYAALRAPLESGWVAQGPTVENFEKAFAARAGAKHAAAVSSCTTAMQLALTCLGIGPGDEVIVPSFSFIATASAVEHTGAQPVFCDVLPGTYNIDPEDFRRRITRRTRAVMPVHLFGLCADMESVSEIASGRGLLVVEDCACAAGSLLGGRHAGTFGDAGCFSFHPRKIITTGEGGMLLTGDRKPLAKAVRLRNHGASAQPHERHVSGGFLLPGYEEAGFNFRMSDIHAALGLSQLAKIDEIIRLRRAAADFYAKNLANIPGISLPFEPEGALHTYQSFVVVLGKKINRDNIAAELHSRGVATRQGTHAIHLLGYYRRKYGLKPVQFPVSRMLHAQSLTLPLFPSITRDQAAFVCSALKDAIMKCGRA